MENIEDWMKTKDNGNIVVETKNGTFELEEKEYEKIIQAKKRFTRTDRDGAENTDFDKFQMALISESLVEPKMGELDIMKLKGSSVFRLCFAVSKLYDLQSFLQK